MGKSRRSKVSDRCKSTVAVSEEMQRAVLNVYEYFCNNVRKYGAANETAKALKLSNSTVSRIIKRGEVSVSKRCDVNNGREKFNKVDDFWKKLIRETIYSFYKNKTAPTIDALHEKLKELSAGTNYEFPYGRTTLFHLVKKLGFNYQKADNRKVLMESPRIVAWRWKYLRQVEKFRSDGSLIVYLDETWFDSHDTARVVWSDNTENVPLQYHIQKVKGWIYVDIYEIDF